MRRWVGFTLIELMIVILIISILMAIALPNLLEARKHGNEANAIKACRTILSAQSLFREKDKEGDGAYDYGTLTELNNTGVIDGVLGSGTKAGFTFVSSAGSQATEFIYFVTANPVVMQGTGDRSFFSNHMGLIFYTNETVVSAALVVNAEVPPGMVPIQ